MLNKFSNIKDPWRKNLYILTVAQFLAMMGMSACVPFLPLFVRQLGATDQATANLWSGLIYAGPYFLSFLAVPVWGALGDKYSRKLNIVRAILGLSIAVALMGFSQNYYQLFALRVLQGILSGFIAATLAFVSAETPKSRSGYAIGLLQSASSGGGIIGPLIGGFLSDLIGMRNVFFFVAFVCIITGLIVHFFVIESKGANEKKSNSVKENLNYAKKDKTLIKYLLVILLSQTGIVLSSPIMAFYLETLGAPQEYLSSITGFLVGIVGLFSIVFAPFWGKRIDAGKTIKILKYSTFIVATALIAHIIAYRFEIVFIFRALMGIFLAAIVPAVYSLINKRTPDDIKGGIMSLGSSATLFAGLIGPTSSGIIANHFGMKWCFIISSILLFSSFILIMRKEK